MLCRILKSFKEGRNEYIEGELRFVSDDLVPTYRRYGWIATGAGVAEPETSGTEAVLNIHDAEIPSATR
jgi:hypothetical protein